MRRFCMVVSLIYGVFVLIFAVPSALLLARMNGLFWPGLYGEVIGFYKHGVTWIPIGSLLCGQAILFFLSVDVVYKQLRPKAHMFVSCLVSSMLLGLLTAAGACSVGVAVYGDKFLERLGDKSYEMFALWLLPSAITAILSYIYLRRSRTYLTSAFSMLLGGSVIELLIAAPCHGLVVRRHDTFAPMATGIAIAAGIAILLLSVGPRMLILYKDRLDSYAEYRLEKQRLVAK